MVGFRFFLSESKIFPRRTDQSNFNQIGTIYIQCVVLPEKFRYVIQEEEKKEKSLVTHQAPCSVVWWYFLGRVFVFMTKVLTDKACETNDHLSVGASGLKKKIVVGQSS